MILRLDQKLAGKIHAGPLPALPAASNPYADWTARLFTADRTQYILMCNTVALYGGVFYGRGVTDVHDLLVRGLEAVRFHAEANGLGLIYHRHIAPLSADVRCAKALNRSVTGSMNELVEMAKCYLVEMELAPADAAERLNETPLSALRYAFAREAIKDLG